MTRLRGHRVVLAFAGMAAIFGVVGVAEAEGGTNAPGTTNTTQSAPLGVATSIRVVLHSEVDGKPAANMPLVFHTNASFAHVTDELELGRATTNADGVAVLTLEPHVAGDHDVSIDYEDAGRPVTVAKVTVSVTGDAQLVHSTAGISIPGLNDWLLIALIASIWSVLLGVSFRVIAIARGGGSPAAAPLTGDLATTPSSHTEADR
jgi:hypothetical protein